VSEAYDCVTDFLPPSPGRICFGRAQVIFRHKAPQIREYSTSSFVDETNRSLDILWSM
jgi:hypothetical protein